MIKNKIVLLILVGVIIVIGIYLLSCNESEYFIKVFPVDDYSPDRILVVYDNHNKKVDVERIEYLDGTLLCDGNNLTVHYGDISDEKELRIILKNNKEKVVNVVKDEVK